MRDLTKILLRFLALIYITLVMFISASLMIPLFICAIFIGSLIYILTGYSIVGIMMRDECFLFPIYYSRCVEFMDWVEEL